LIVFVFITNFSGINFSLMKEVMVLTPALNFFFSFIMLHLYRVKHFIILLFLFFFFAGHAGKERVFIDNSKPLNEKEAILILPGFGSRVQGTKHIADFFFNKGYDVYIPDYIARKSINNCVNNLDKFIIKYKFKEYKKIHVFSYIVGS